MIYTLTEKTKQDLFKKNPPTKFISLEIKFNDVKNKKEYLAKIDGLDKDFILNRVFQDKLPGFGIKKGIYEYQLSGNKKEKFININDIECEKDIPNTQEREYFEYDGITLKFITFDDVIKSFSA